MLEMMMGILSGILYFFTAYMDDPKREEGSHYDVFRIPTQN